MASIKLPVTPPSAYDPQRTPNALLLAHVRELEKAVSEAGRRVRRKKPRTEEQVAAYIRHLNRALYHQVLLPRMKRRPLDVPLDELAPVKAKPPARTNKHRSSSSARGKKKAAPSRKRARSRR